MHAVLVHTPLQRTFDVVQLVGVGRYRMWNIPTLSHLLRSWVPPIDFGVRFQLGAEV